MEYLFKIYNVLNRFAILLNNRKEIKECYLCKKKFERFFPYRVNSFTEKLVDNFQIIGSDVDNFGCCYCGCHDRERHLSMYFDKLGLWGKLENSKVLHIAPEIHISKKISSIVTKEYVRCDLFPKKDELKVDITKIVFSDSYFDFIICNHVLEHVSDYRKAFSELKRVLVPGGTAILQTPFSELLYNNFEDKNINTDKLRLLFYGQEDHCRVVSKRQFLEDLKDFFQLDIVKNCDLFTNEECFKYGVNKKEDLVLVKKY